MRIPILNSLLDRPRRISAALFRRCGALAVVAMLAATGARAEDIDIFGAAYGGGLKPNVLIIVDNDSVNNAAYTSVCPYTASPHNLDNKKLIDMVECSLYDVLEKMKSNTAMLGKINVGLLTYGPTFRTPNAPPWNLPTLDLGGINAMQATIRGRFGTASGGLDEGMIEAWSWFTGNVSPRTGVNYGAHFNPATCDKMYIILIGAAAKNGRACNGEPCGVDSELINAYNLAGQTVPSPLAINTSNLGANRGEEGSMIDEWARFLYQTDFGAGGGPLKRNIVTYSIAGSGEDKHYAQILKSAARQGGGKTFEATDLETMRNALLLIFSEVAATNSVFASASLPVSVNAQGTYLNQIYIGMFRPDQHDQPRWTGNLKQYQFGVDVTNPADPQLYLADAAGTPALSAAGTGFVIPTAKSFWTKKNTGALPDSLSSNGGYFINNWQGESDGFDSPDGEIVEKGGVSQQLRLATLTANYSQTPGTSQNPRRLYTCIAGSDPCAANTSLSTMQFATTNADITGVMLGATGAPLTVSSIVRTGYTATATLSSAPSPALTVGQTIFISGSKYPEYNGTYTTTAVPSSTTFTFNITVNPPVTADGTYTATVATSPKTVTSLTRSGTTATATASAHGYAVGQTVTISGATGTEYNGSRVITSVPGVNTFTFTVTPGPTTPSGGGTAKVGSTTLSLNTVNGSPPGIVRAAPSATNVSVVTVTLASNHTWANGNLVTIAGAGTGGISPYNGTWTIIATGTNCLGGVASRSFCFNFNSTPASPDPGGAGGTITADASTTPINITALSRGDDTCTNSGGSANATATAQTATPPPFFVGNTVSIAGTPGSNEQAYMGTYAVTAVNKTTVPYTFSYVIGTSPGVRNGNCADTVSGMKATVGDAIVRTQLINWVRGEDNIGDEYGPGGTITVRPSVHGDVVHSRPAIVNYGNGKIVAFYGANDGVFRAVNANQTGNIGTTVPGGEMWGFIPMEFYSKLGRQFKNSPLLKLATTPSGLTPAPVRKDYFFDGDIGVYQTAGNGKVYIYLSARRGGRIIYALDVTDPDIPKFLWKRTSADTGFGELGQTWSAPKVARVRGYTSGPVLIFGAGYDEAEDAEPPATATMGRGIFVLDALTGDIVWRASGGGASDSCTGASGGTPCALLSMTYPIPAAVTLTDRNLDGKMDRAYASDTGGNIWRIDFEDGTNMSPSSWKVTKFAAVGGASGDSTKRKFLFPPDVLFTPSYDIVMASTGDREHPVMQQQSYSIKNRFYMMKDPNNGVNGNPQTPPVSWTPIADTTSSAANTAPPSTTLFNCSGCIGATPSVTYNPTGNRGFYIALPNTGEKGVNEPKSIGGYVYFGTHSSQVPVAGVCSNGLGTGRAYKVNVLTGQTTSTRFDTEGIPPSPVVGMVTINFPGEAQPRTVPFLIGGGANALGTDNSADARSSFGGRIPVRLGAQKRYRKYWMTEHGNGK